ncbi:chloride channel protein [Aminobacter sp. UC22_36]|uniref:chloride channel protein n=1 Tax=Aminobacter sp. UC22_36 TaxID=3374549 RepID=UPI003757C462
MSNRQVIRLVLLAAGVGLLAGISAALTLWLMQKVSHAVWSVSDAIWYIPLVTVAGGALIGLTRLHGPNPDLDQQIAAAQDPAHLHRRNALFIALAAIVAVGFGGAIGPEAGLLAVVAELTSAIAIVLGRSHAEQRVIGEAGVSGALSGLFGSPLGAAAYADDKPQAPRALLVLAALCGLLGFLLASRFLFDGGLHRLALPSYAPAGDGTDLVMAIFPAILGAAIGMAFLFLHPVLKHAIETRAPWPFWQPVAGGIVFGLLAMAFPILRFSGHHEIEPMLAWAGGVGMAALLLLGLLKVLALSICLSTGWLGGGDVPADLCRCCCRCCGARRGARHGGVGGDRRGHGCCHRSGSRPADRRRADHAVHRRPGAVRAAVRRCAVRLCRRLAGAEASGALRLLRSIRFRHP